jgi:hypothetical protein
MFNMTHQYTTIISSLLICWLLLDNDTSLFHLYASLFFIVLGYYSLYASGAAQGGGGSVKNRKPIGELYLAHNCWMLCGVVQLYL